MALLKLVYRMLLAIYPAAFRATFGAEMEGVFAETLAEKSGLRAATGLLWREFCHLPGAALQLYWRQPVWALSAAGALPDDPSILEISLRRAYYRRLFLKLLKAALFIGLLTLAVYLHGYLYTTYTLRQNAQEFGVYPTLDEAIEASIEQFGQYYRNFRFDGFSKGQENTEFIWYAVVRGHADSLADGSPLNPRHNNRVEGGFFVVHTKDGWVRYNENLWIEIGCLAGWMDVYRLYGK
jgi:hypothetical protein